MRPEEIREVVERYEWVFTSGETALLKRVAAYLKEAGYEPVETLEFVYAAGKVPIMLVAHGDTVHRTPPQPEEVFCDPAKGVLWSPVGLGVDDRAGVLGILELVNRGYRPHVLVTLGEESGGTGASAFVACYRSLPVRYIVELDRRNGGEAVFYGCNNKKFVEYIESYGFKSASGSFSDISIICPELGIAGVNLSCGYYNAHSQNEYLVLPQLWETLSKLERMLQSPPKKQFKYTEGGGLFGKSLFSRNSKTLFGSLRGGSIYDWEMDAARYSGYGGSYGGRYGYSHRYGLLHTVTVYVDPLELAYMYGGTEEFWESVLEDMEGELERVAEDAVYEAVVKYADTLLEEGGTELSDLDEETRRSDS